MTVVAGMPVDADGTGEDAGRIGKDASGETAEVVNS